MSSSRLVPQPPLPSSKGENLAAANERARRAAAMPLPKNANYNEARKAAIKQISPNGDEGVNDEMSSLNDNSPVSYKSLASNNARPGVWPSPKEEAVVPAPSPFRALSERIASPFRSRAASEASEPGVPVVTPPKRPSLTPSMLNKFRNSFRSPSRMAALTEMEKHTHAHFLTSFLQKAYVPQRANIKSDIWYSRAIDTPNAFAEMLIKSSNVTHFKIDGKLLFDEEDMKKIRSFLTPEVIRAAVNARRPSYLLEIARSPCFEEIILKDSAKFLRFKNGATNASLNEPERKAYADGLPGFYGNVAEMLLDGADIGNFDNLEWDIPANVAEGDRLKYIYDNHLIPTGVKPGVAMKRFSRSDPYLRRRSRAESQDPVSEGGKRKTRRSKRRGLRKTLRRK